MCSRISMSYHDNAICKPDDEGHPFVACKECGKCFFASNGTISDHKCRGDPLLNKRDVPLYCYLCERAFCRPNFGSRKYLCLICTTEYAGPSKRFQKGKGIDKDKLREEICKEIPSKSYLPPRKKINLDDLRHEFDTGQHSEVYVSRGLVLSNQNVSLPRTNKPFLLNSSKIKSTAGSNSTNTTTPVNSTIINGRSQPMKRPGLVTPPSHASLSSLSVEKRKIISESKTKDLTSQSESEWSQFSDCDDDVLNSLDNIQSKSFVFKKQRSF